MADISVADFATVSPLIGNRLGESDASTTWFAAYDGDELIGCCGVRRLQANPRVALFYPHFVKHEYRRQHVYRALARFRHDWARRHGIDFGVAACNESVLPALEEQGFETIEYWPNYQLAAADLRVHGDEYSIEDAGVVRRLRERFAPEGTADREHAGRGGLGFGLVHYSLVRLYAPERVLAIGSRHGFIPACIAAALQANGNGRLDFVDANLSDNSHGFDTAWGGVAHWNTGNFGSLSPYVSIHLMRSEEFFAVGDASRHYDYVHIDGAHNSNAVQHDFYAAAEHLTEDGLITLHDPLVQRKGFGVGKLLESLSPYQWRHTVLPPWPGLAIVQRARRRTAS
jgi:GNAT superfamily N-acetyltransferase